MPLLIEQVRPLEVLSLERYRDEKDELALSPDELVPGIAYIARLIKPYARVLEDTSKYALELYHGSPS